MIVLSRCRKSSITDEMPTKKNKTSSKRRFGPQQKLAAEINVIIQTIDAIQSSRNTAAAKREMEGAWTQLRETWRDLYRVIM